MSEKLQEVVSGPEIPEKGFGAWIAGRGNRRSYWLLVGPSIVFVEITSALDQPWGRFVVMLPVLFAMIRRLHDLGRTGWWAPAINIATNLTGFAMRAVVSLEGASALQTLLAYAVLLIFGAIPGQSRGNAFGPPPGRKPDLAETFS